jgi:hypothetical protein
VTGVQTCALPISDYVLEAADLNRAINPRWREGDPTPMPVRRAHTWGLR